jgi:hypothetical protein
MVVEIINKVFDDLNKNKDLDDFQISKEIKKGFGNALSDSVILEHNFYGIGFSFKKMKEYFKNR